jgi:flagellar biosynthesis regulator FlbT
MPPRPPHAERNSLKKHKKALKNIRKHIKRKKTQKKALKNIRKHIKRKKKALKNTNKI